MLWNTTSMVMKRRSIGLLLCCVLLLCGCNLFQPPEPTPTPAPTLVPTPTPSPTPAPAVVVAAPETAKQFLAHAIPDTFRLRHVSGGAAALASQAFAGETAVVLYWTGAEGEAEAVETLLERGVGTVVFAPEGAEVPQGAVCVRAVRETVAEAAVLDLAIAYPPHDTPVRLFGLFESRESAACTAWQAAVAEGRVFVKGAYYASEAEESAEAWMAGRLERYFEGMVDGIYAETAELAVAAAQALLAAGRSDMEIFCTGSSDALLDLMEAHPALVAAAYGVDEAEAGRMCISLAEQMLEGKTPEGASLTAAPVGAAAQQPTE